MQANATGKELEQLDRQILAAEVRQAITENELKNHDLQIEQATALADFMRSKFTSVDLYDWMVSQLSSVYFQGYKLAYEMAKRAEKAFQFERSSDETFVQFGYWDSLKKGLLSGEKLYHDLKRIEMAYLDQNRRELEITKHVSLAQVDAMALVSLRQEGRCSVELPEELFDLDYPGHYLRRLKTVSISIPGVTGPYTSVNCTLTLLANRLRRSAEVGADYQRTKEGDPRFAENVGAVQSIVTSNGQNDSGLFEGPVRDERYLPFEGAGAISDWQIELPAETNQFDCETITDVILHVRYTARDGGSGLRTAALDSLSKIQAAGGLRLFSARHEMGAEWQRFFSRSQGEYTLTLPLLESRFPFLAAPRTRDITQLQLGFKLASGVASGPLHGTLKWGPSSEAELKWVANGSMAGLIAATATFNDGVPPGTFSVILKQEEVNSAPPAWLVEVDGIKRFNPEVVRDLYVMATFTTSLPPV